MVSIQLLPQYLASLDNNFEVRDVQHFDVHTKLPNDKTTNVFTKELELIKQSLTKVIILNCGADHAKILIREANQMGLMDSTYVWITTDEITSNPDGFGYDGSFPTFYQGIIGTVPNFGQGASFYNTFKDQYIIAGGSSKDIGMNSIKISEALEIVHAQLDSGSWNSPSGLQCGVEKFWDQVWSVIFSTMYYTGTMVFRNEHQWLLVNHAIAILVVIRAFFAVQIKKNISYCYVFRKRNMYF